MAIEVSCSNCGEEFRVKDEAAGKSFKCKVCGTKIFIPEVADQADVDEDEVEDLPPARRRSRDAEDEGSPKRRKKGSTAKRKTLGPAIALYVTSGLWLAYGIANLIYSLFLGGSDAYFKDLAAQVDQSQASARMFGYYIGVFGVPLSTVPVLSGAYCLQSCRMYGLALTGCILACIPCCSPGCVLGIPFGIWGLIVLNQEDVKRAFQ